MVTCRYIHVVDKGLGDMDCAGRAMELQWDYYGPFGFAAVLAEADEPFYDLSMKVTADLLRQKETAIHGSKLYLIDTIMKVKQECGYDGFMFHAWFELGGFACQEVEDQMSYFAEEIMPVLHRECGGNPVKDEPSRLRRPASHSRGVTASVSRGGIRNDWIHHGQAVVGIGLADVHPRQVDSDGRRFVRDHDPDAGVSDRASEGSGTLRHGPGSCCGPGS
ncbi:hypothetical protein FHU38_000083 [Saccharomonospora amisosensis]|uniref:Uncharacterized protein n=1 Tax=Saccharomonospora amisosensis TaxID=1128677 RepID=A0A7X5UKL3_9PSEU|nr:MULTISPECIES: hypothetical protein [Saccharomonospora]NIJ09739.1 hypothetical protein [Saccharomonospora amisosensis]